MPHCFRGMISMFFNIGVLSGRSIFGQHCLVPGRVHTLILSNVVYQILSAENKRSCVSDLDAVVVGVTDVQMPASVSCQAPRTQLIPANTCTRIWLEVKTDAWNRRRGQRCEQVFDFANIAVPASVRYKATHSMPASLPRMLHSSSSFCTL